MLFETLPREILFMISGNCDTHSLNNLVCSSSSCYQVFNTILYLQNASSALFFTIDKHSNSSTAIQTLNRAKFAGVNINQLDRLTLRTPLYAAIKKSSEAITVCLLDNGAQIDEPSDNGAAIKFPCAHTPVGLAASNGWTDLVSSFLEKGARIDDVSGRYPYQRFPPIYAAFFNKHRSTAKLLIDRGASLECFRHNSLLSLAAGHGWNDVVTHLIDKGAQIKEDPVNITPPLQVAFMKKHESTVQLLLDRGAPLKPDSEHAALGLAASNGWDDIVDCLLDKKVSIDTPSGSNQQPPLEIALRNGNESTSLLLIKRDACLEFPGKDGKDGKDGNHALHIAAVFGLTDVMRYLISVKRCDVNHKNKKGLTPLHQIIQAPEGKDTIVRFLLELGSNVDLPWDRSVYGEIELISPLALALKLGKLDIAATLLAKNALIPKQQSGFLDKLIGLDYDAFEEDRDRMVLSVACMLERGLRNTPSHSEEGIREVCCIESLAEHIFSRYNGHPDIAKAVFDAKNELYRAHEIFSRSSLPKSYHDLGEF
ncbi:ankyrin repeat-containing domain protein [Mariannaea sp. PMI_226]|nr:ankyrin repeat-containing domain protein [Mariannaea sp. PMI_226]